MKQRLKFALELQALQFTVDVQKQTTANQNKILFITQPERSPIFKLVIIHCSFLTCWGRLAYPLQLVASRGWVMLPHKLGECELIVQVPAMLL
jgi:hypothetical protein